MNAGDFRELVSGRRRGVWASALRSGLYVASLGYSAAMRIRNARYDAGKAEQLAVGAPVVCVGNLTLGGTGKTPMVEWIARWFRARDVRVSIVSRGYGATEGSRNDEALELEQKLPDVPHLQNVDRAEGARTAIEEFESQVVLLDDGFQHRRLLRDLDVVLLDALEPTGFGHVVPRGTLREPLSGLRRAQAIVLSRADLVDAEERLRLRREISQYAPQAIWAEVRHAPRLLLNSLGREAELATLAGKRVVGFCGLGNPDGFRRTLAGLGCEVVDFREFPDHHNYQRADIDDLADRAAKHQADALVCTHKDLVKVRLDALAGKPIWAVVVGLEFLAGQAELEELLEPLMPQEGE